MPCSQNISLRPPILDIPTKAGVSADNLVDESPQKVGAQLCTICHKDPAVVGGLCIDCDHLMGDIQIDQVGPITNRRTT